MNTMTVLRKYPRN